MLVFELSVPTLSPAFKSVRPFIFSLTPGVWATAAYWTTAFGAPAESSIETMYIASFTRDGINRYASVASYALCLATEQSFYWDNTNQVLYVHMEHDQFPIGPVWQYGKTYGYCKERSIYIDNIFYAPLIESIPSLEQSQDLEAYDALNFMSGSVILKNQNGYIDWMLENQPFGFDCQIASFEDVKGVDVYTRSDLTYRAALYVEKPSFTLQKTTLNLQDRRKAQNIKVPTELFNATDYPDIDDSEIDKPIPLLYGSVRAVTPIRTNGKTESGIVSYRIAQSISTMGTVQVKKTVNDQEVWVTVATDSVTLETGEFTLSDAVGRDASNNPYDVRVLNPNYFIPRIDEVNNPLIAGAQETSRVMRGDTCHVFYSAGGGALYHAIATDALCRILTGAAATNISVCRFPAVFRYTETFVYNSTYYIGGAYVCITHLVDQGPLYMYISTDGVSWTRINGNQPVMSAGTGIYSYFWNPCICIDEDGDTMHFVIECGTQADQSDVGLAYSYGSFADLLAGSAISPFSFETNLSAGIIIPGGGNPYIEVIPDRDAILVLAGSVNTKGRTLWQIMANYASITADLSDPASWTESPYFEVLYVGMHTADPDLVVLPASKTYGLLMGYMYNQASSYQCYFDMTLNELYDAIVSGVSANPADIIQALNLRYLGAQYLTSEYDTTEWAAAKATLSNIGIYINDQTELHELIRQMQSGANIGFRYEFNALGQRTIRIDDWDRAPTFYIPRERIANIKDVEITSDPDLLAATVKLYYDKDYSGTLSNAPEENKDFLYVIDSTQKTAVQLAYRQEPQLEFTTLIRRRPFVLAKALRLSERYSVARMLVTVRVIGIEYLSQRIYDTGIVELVPTGYDRDSATVEGVRQWVGVWRAIVLGVNPDISAKTNELTLALIENITDVVPLLSEFDGILSYLTTEDGEMLFTR